MQTNLSWEDPRFAQKLKAAIGRTQQLLNAALEQVMIARELRATSGELRQTNRDFREFLRAKCLRVMGRGEAWAKGSALQSPDSRR